VNQEVSFNAAPNLQTVDIDGGADRRAVGGNIEQRVVLSSDAQFWIRQG